MNLLFELNVTGNVCFTLKYIGFTNTCISALIILWHDYLVLTRQRLRKNFSMIDSGYSNILNSRVQHPVARVSIGFTNVYYRRTQLLSLSLF
jgi:hypothetical protein